jgi:hypothetical protein
MTYVEENDRTNTTRQLQCFRVLVGAKMTVSTELYSQNQLMALSPLLIHAFYRLFFARIMIAAVRTATLYNDHSVDCAVILLLWLTLTANVPSTRPCFFLFLTG